MKLAVVSDVHGNLAALEAVLADLEAVKPDLVVHGGDLVFNGPHPAECVDLIRELGWPGVMGNTDEALWTLPATLPDNALHIFGVIAKRTRTLLGDKRVAWLKTLPLIWHDADRVAVVHAVPGDTWKVVPVDAVDAELREIYGPLGARLAVYCHIHRPYVRNVGDFTLANSGSVGMPFDGDRRAAYLLVQDGRPEIRRVGYNVRRYVAELERSDYPTSRWLVERARTATAASLALNS
ncbi:MAG: metallophosphoesterase family protein [Candidatus Dormibacteraceae bacterium]